jgi:hypothetical protein
MKRECKILLLGEYSFLTDPLPNFQTLY